MKLRTRIHLIIAALSMAFLLLAMSVEIENLRQSTHEEIEAASSVASRVLVQAANSLAANNPTALVPYLESLGRVRAHDITLKSNEGRTLYTSPSSTYKLGRNAPQWFTKLLQPEVVDHQFALPNGLQLYLAADASRAILDAWDDVTHLLIAGIGLIVLLNALVFWLVSRALAPLPVIVNALDQLRGGEASFRLQKLSGVEANTIATAFNNMASALQEKSQLEQRARETEARLEESRELAILIDRRIEEERRMIARELHDEFSQSMTAIRSLAVSIASQSNSPATQEAAQLISSESARVYDAMHSLIPRLTPLSLDSLGLIDTLQGLIEGYRRSHTSVALSLTHSLTSTLAPSVTLALYRVTQEALSNALRHGQPTRIDVDINQTEERIAICIRDNGQGLPEDWTRPGRFGLRGLRERVEQLHGSFAVENRSAGGVELRAAIPTV